MMQTGDLEAMREWAAQRLRAGQETPWDWYQLMKLREALEALMQSERTELRLPVPVELSSTEQRSGNGPRLAVDNSHAGFKG